MLVLRPDAASWVDTALEPHVWCPAEWHLVIMNALRLEYGEQGARDFGAARLRDSLRAGATAPILRCWMRSYGSAPGDLLRVTPYIWNAVTRAVGRVTVTSSREREVEVQVTGLPETARRCTGWHRYLEGYGAAWLAAGSYEGARVEVGSGPAPGRVDARVTW